jgi:hypothetical protein
VHLALSGWALARPAPDSDSAAAALLALDLLERIPTLAPGARLTLVAPPGEVPELPAAAGLARTPRRRARWEQVWYEQHDAPRAAAAAGADLLLLTGPAAPLRSPVPVAALLTRDPQGVRAGLPERLRDTLAATGLAGAALRVAWADLPPDLDAGARLQRLPPAMSPSFHAPEIESTGAGYVLTHLASAQDAPALLAAWTWVEAGVGDAVELRVCGALDEEALAGQARALGLDTVRFQPLAEAAQLPRLYGAAEAVLSAGAGGGWDLRWAMARGTPLAAFDTPIASAVVGPGGYLVPPGDARALGAACLTLLVEPDVARALRARALERAEAYRGAQPLRALWAALEAAARPAGR